MNNLLKVVKISGTHHLKGGVKGISYLDDPSILIGKKVIAEGRTGSKRVLTVSEVGGLNGSKITLTFEEVKDKVEGATLANNFLFIKRDLLDISDDEYLVSDLIHMDVVDEKYGDIGKVVDVFETAAHDIFIVEGSKGEIMIPNIDEFIISIDFNENIIKSKVIEGMVEED